MNKPLTEMTLPELQREYIQVTNDFLAALREGRSWEELEENRKQLKEVIRNLDAKEGTPRKS